MVVASIYQHGVTTQLRCDPDMETKTVTFGVVVWLSHHEPSTLPKSWQERNEGVHLFPTWPEAVSCYEKIRSEIRQYSREGGIV